MEAEHTGGILEGSEGVGIDIINAEVVIVQQENVNIMDITVETPQNVEQVELVEEMPGPLAKKRKKNERAWKKTVAKVARHRPKGFPQMPSCKHSAKSKYRCAELSLQDVRKIHQQYYKDADLQSKKNFILQHVIVSSAKRTRLPEGIKSKRNVSTDFFLPKMRNNKTENVKVCRAALLTILQESKNRVQLICKKYLETGVVPLETRGGARQVDKYNIKKDSIKSFIKTFIPVQKHYCRAKNKHRQYLPSELNITKMWKMYIEQHPTEELKCEYDFFRLVFSENFNIGFDAPYTDKCSTCTRLECELATEKDAGKRETLKLNLKAHKVRADKFYKLLQENNDKELILSYDCQKNLVLPKIPDQAAYYKRQLYLYNFVICEGHSKVLLNSENTFSYLWTENQYAKGSSQIASAVYHRLTSANMENVTTVKLFSDGCGGQNKNTTVVGMIAHWLLKDAPKHVTKVVLLFPVVGHSFIPPDRVFGVLERKFQDLSVINNPNEYTEIIEKHCTVVKLGTDCPVSDWKTLTDAVLKKTRTMAFSISKGQEIYLFKK
ncbi:uncharacterized protein LOC124370144 [Homalodisca vitripennis]|uniref:uncharacterized protein LOC124370144 n=1 Tax=Homalodisca vitripennis TaxID=197043 RepID=UPI001EEA3F5C|nr:uncharacterized protein LOC124370144 [Homalodisca vitripennis]